MSHRLLPKPHRRLPKMPHITPTQSTCKSNTPSKILSSVFISDSLGKLAITICDRASNEKLADKPLASWRDEILSQCDQKPSVEYSHCISHVLLGFHKYAFTDLKLFETSTSKRMSLLVVMFFPSSGQKGGFVLSMLREQLQRHLDELVIIMVYGIDGKHNVPKIESSLS